MTFRFAVFTLGVLFAVSSGSDVSACGDKYFVTVQSTRNLLAGSSKRVEGLIYKKPASEVARLYAAVPVENALRKDGFQLTVAATESEFKTEVARNRWAIIIAAVDDAEKLRASKVIDGATIVLPVVDTLAAAETKRLKERFPDMLKATPANSEAFLSAVYKALSHRPKAAGKSAASEH